MTLTNIIMEKQYQCPAMMGGAGAATFPRADKEQMTTVIDFKKLYEEEKALSKVKLTVKASSLSNTFNMLQDMRHLLIIDLRTEEEFNLSRVRKSVLATPGNYQEKLV
jgi:hypothetical protein